MSEEESSASSSSSGETPNSPRLVNRRGFGVSEGAPSGFGTASRSPMSPHSAELPEPGRPQNEDSLRTAGRIAQPPPQEGSSETAGDVSSSSRPRAPGFCLA